MFLWGLEDLTGAPQAQLALRRGNRSSALPGWGCERAQMGYRSLEESQVSLAPTQAREPFDGRSARARCPSVQGQPRDQERLSQNH